MMDYEKACKMIDLYEYLCSCGLKPQTPPESAMVNAYMVVNKQNTALLQQVRMLVEAWNGFSDESKLILETIRELLGKEKQEEA